MILSQAPSYDGRTHTKNKELRRRRPRTVATVGDGPLVHVGGFSLCSHHGEICIHYTDFLAIDLTTF